VTTADTPLARAQWAALDFESAGLAPGRTDEPVQVGIVGWSGAALAGEEVFRSFIASPARITRQASAVHGIRDRDLAGAPSMLALWPEFRRRLAGRVIVAHGAGTERRFLRAFPMHGFGPWLDTLALSRAVWPDLPDHALGTVVGRLGLEAAVRGSCPGLDWHDALFDAAACAVLLRHLLAAPEFESAAVGQLLQLDRAGYHERRRLLRAAREAGWRED
jgi:DNA polymerase-3 subunit epsilon